MRLLEELAHVRTFAVAFAVIMAVGVAAVGNQPLRSDGSIDTRVSDLIFTVLVPLAVLAWFAALITYRILFYRRIKSYESRDASRTTVAPGPRFRAQGAVLLSLGFQPVGQVEQRWPWQNWKMAWVFTDPIYRVDARIGMGAFPCFSSHWTDGSCLITTKARRDRTVDLHDARLVWAPGSDEAVFARHVQQAAEFGQSRGERLPTESMVDVVAHGAAELPMLRGTMRAVWLRPSVVLSFGFGTGLMLLLIVSGLHVI